MADEKRKLDSAVKGRPLESGASKNGPRYRSATTGRYVTRSTDGDPSKRPREIRGRFRAAGRRFSDSADIVREDRDSAD